MYKETQPRRTNMIIQVSTEEAQKILSQHFEDRLGNEHVHVEVGDAKQVMGLKYITLKKSRELLDSGNKINAIKYMRSVSGLGLAEAKSIIDRLKDTPDNIVLASEFNVEYIDEV
jgi:ribosomal protein L7/L12